MVNIFHCLWKAESSILSILAKYGYVAQLVEHETENLGVGGSYVNHPKIIRKIT
jgi:hypothetical protein